MHPCREYWGQDIAYGSLVTGDRARRVHRAAGAPETYILDVDDSASCHGQLAALVRRINGFDGREEGLKQSAAHLREFLLAEKKAGIGGAAACTPEFADPRDSDVRILGIATLHRSCSPFTASLAERAGLPSRAEREAASAQLCAEFMQRLTELGEREDVDRIDWVVVRVRDDPSAARAHLGATRVSHVALQPFSPEPEPARDAIGASSSGESPPAA